MCGGHKHCVKMSHTIFIYQIRGFINLLSLTGWQWENSLWSNLIDLTTEDLYGLFRIRPPWAKIEANLEQIVSEFLSYKS